MAILEFTRASWCPLLFTDMLPGILFNDTDLLCASTMLGNSNTNVSKRVPA